MRERDIFIAALPMNAPERAAYLASACGGDSELRRVVDELLEEHEREQTFFLDVPFSDGKDAVDQPVSEKPGTIIGPYKLLQQIGEGGMGVVYMAEQTVPVQRKVALKVIKPGMDSRQVIARFEAERQALAIMDHVNIARVLDAGATESGRPFFVMELVNGVPITKYCDDNRLTPRKRLELFVPVCQAIQHAHQKGIIHRDIKPSNVMVTLYDGKPVPKVIDFGVAKATEQKLTERTLFTQYGTMVGTLEYMSPEQAEMSALGVDTRSDIYSLGVLLYELLTGSTPLSSKRMKEAAFAEILRLIKEEEPPKPSTRLSDSGEALASISAQRQMEPTKLSKLLRGELDWIVMKALEKDRNRRFETASGFALDVQCYLADEPVQACPPSAAYRLGKFARRNRLKLVAAAVLATALLVAIGGVGWAVRDRAAQQADVARARAERLARASANVQPILAETNRLMADQKWPEALAAARRAGAAVAGSETDEATAQRVRQLQMDLEFIDRLEQIRMQWATWVEGTFDYARAVRDYASAFRDYGVDVEELTVERSIDRLKARPALAIPVAAALDDWNHVRLLISERDAAGRKRLVAVARGIDPEPLRDQLRSAWGRPDSEVQDELRQLAQSIDIREHHPATIVSLARTLNQGKYSESSLLLLRDAQSVYPADYWLNFELALALNTQKDHERAIRFYTAAVSIRPNSAAAHNNLGNALSQLKKLDEAIACYRAAIEIDPTHAIAHHKLATSLAKQNKLEEAIGHHKKVIELDPKFAIGHHNFGVTWIKRKKPSEAIACFRKAIELDPKSVLVQSNLGAALFDLNKPDEGIAAFRKAIELDPNSALAHGNLGAALRKLNKLDEAVAAFRKALEIEPNCGHASNLGDALFAQKKPDEAIAAFRKAIELDPTSAEAYCSLGGVLLHRKKPAEALAVCRKAIELDPAYAQSYLNLGAALSGLKKHDEAVIAYRKALELDPKSAVVHSNLANVLTDQKKTDEAIAHCRLAIELDANLALAHNNLGTALFAQTRLTEAGDAFRQAIKLDPNLANAHIGQGNVLFAQNKLDEAIAAYHRGLAIEPNNGDRYHNLAVMLMRQNKVGEAIVAYRKATEVEPNKATHHLSLGSVFHGQNRYAEAGAAYRTATQVDPQFALAFGVLGDVLVEQNKLDEAFACYHRALEINPGSALCYCGLGEALAKDGKLDSAVAAFRKANELDPKYARAFSELGRALQAQGKLDEAVIAYQKAIEFDPVDLDVRLGLGSALYLQKKFAEAVDVYQQAIRLTPNHPNCHLFLGVALEGQGKLDEAIAAYRQVIEVYPKLAVAYGSLGQLLAVQGKMAEAIAAYEEVIRLAPEGPTAMHELAWLLANGSDPKFRNAARAVEFAKKAVELAPTNHSFRNTLGVAHYRTSNWKAALEALDESQELRKGGESKDWFFRAMAHWQLGDKEAARTWYTQAVTWTDKHQAKNDELRRFQAEAAELIGPDKKMEQQD